ncbi:putative component of dynein regulatory complex [Paratrimastix pyriformis]|uniref:Component of dynein regulatory complex n=1 Tax=Paratrimastix pyriformis TaxID=342808 RepID=A0ABQ8UIJ5_9EUKA|nr:putative component of dynein regulatory complex [Paratrimastix pyriformis]
MSRANRAGTARPVPEPPAPSDPVEELRQLTEEALKTTLETAQQDAELQLRLRNLTQVERDKVNQYWNVARKEVGLLKARLKNVETEMEQDKEDHRAETRSSPGLSSPSPAPPPPPPPPPPPQQVEQKVTADLDRHEGELKRVELEKETLLKLASDLHETTTEKLKKEKKGLKEAYADMEGEFISQVTGQKVQENAEMLSKSLDAELAALQRRLEEKLERLRLDLDLRRKVELREIEERKNRHINELLRRHRAAFAEAKSFYNEITRSNLRMIRSLKARRPAPVLPPPPAPVCCWDGGLSCGYGRGAWRRVGVAAQAEIEQHDKTHAAILHQRSELQTRTDELQPQLELAEQKVKRKLLKLANYEKARTAAPHPPIPYSPSRPPASLSTRPVRLAGFCPDRSAPASLSGPCQTDLRSFGGLTIAAAAVCGGATDRASLQNTTTRIGAIREQIGRLTAEHDDLEARFQKAQQDRDDLEGRFEEALERVHAKSRATCDVLNARIERAHQDLLEKETRLNEILRASHLDPAALRVVTQRLDEVLSAKNKAIRDLQYEVHRVTKAHNDAVRVYEAKLIEFGVPPEELGYEPVLTRTTTGPAGLVSALGA